MHRWKFSALAAAAFVSAALTATDATALSLGALNVQSTLGEPLRADIHIPQSTPAELDSLQAQIASAELFRAQGMDLSNAARSIQVTLQRRPDGTAQLQLRSTTPINDPFLDVVIDTRWNTGNMVRSYTLLLDPPRTTPAAEATTPAQVTSAALAPTPAPAPVRTVSTEPARPVAAAPAPAAAPARPVRTTSSAPRAPAATPAAPAKAEPAQVTVRRGDTAGRLANASRPQGVSLDQMLVAMLRSNPKAFSNGNVNQLRAGVVVKMPDREQALSTSAAEARQIVAAQSRDFNAYRRGLAAKAPEAAVKAADRASSGQVKAHVQDTRPAATAPDKLTLSKGGVQDTATAEDKLAAQKQAKEQANRLSELQRNLAELNQLSQTPAPATPTAAPTAPAGTPPAAPAVATPNTPAVPVTAPVLAAATPTAPVPTAAPDAPPTAPTAESAPTVESLPAAAPDAAADAAATTDSVAVPPVAEPSPTTEAAPVAAPAPADAPRFIGSITANPLLPAGAGIVALLLALLGYKSWQRKKAAEQADDDNFADYDPTLDARFAAADAQDPDTVALSADTAGAPLSSDDAVAQADDLMAYGRDVQAEAVLLHALGQQPRQLAVHAKLAEIYAKRQDVGAFESTAQELHDYSAGEGPEWAKVAALGQRLSPGNPLYAVSSPATPFAAALSTSTFAQALSSTPAGATDASMPTDANSDLDLSLDLDLPGGLADAPARGAATPTEIAALHTMPSDADFAALDVPANANPKAPTEALDAMPNAPATSNAPDFDFDVAKFEASAKPAAPTEPVNGSAPAAPGIDLDFTLDDVPAPATVPAPSATATDHLAFDIGSLDLDLGPNAAPADLPEAGHNAAGDPLSTKLDLAQEFNTIGDSEGARSLIEEVLAEASGSLKERAQQMLSKID